MISPVLNVDEWRISLVQGRARLPPPPFPCCYVKTKLSPTYLLDFSNTPPPHPLECSPLLTLLQSRLDPSMMSHFLRNRTSIMPLYMDDVSTLSILIFKRLSSKSEQSQSTCELLLSINETLWGIILKHWVFKWMWLANTNDCRSILFVSQTSNLEIKKYKLKSFWSSFYLFWYYACDSP